MANSQIIEFKKNTLITGGLAFALTPATFVDYDDVSGVDVNNAGTLATYKSDKVNVHAFNMGIPLMAPDMQAQKLVVIELLVNFSNRKLSKLASVERWVDMSPEAPQFYNGFPGLEKGEPYVRYKYRDTPGGIVKEARLDALVGIINVSMTEPRAFLQCSSGEGGW